MFFIEINANMAENWLGGNDEKNVENMKSLQCQKILPIKEK